MIQRSGRLPESFVVFYFVFVLWLFLFVRNGVALFYAPYQYKEKIYEKRTKAVVATFVRLRITLYRYIGEELTSPQPS